MEASRSEGHLRSKHAQMQSARERGRSGKSEKGITGRTGSDRSQVCGISAGLAAAIRRASQRQSDNRGLSLDHEVPYIAAGAGAAFFARRAFRFAGFFAALRRVVFLAAPRAPTLRTVRFFLPAAFRLDFLAVIGM
jgi:hypothetical protein